MKTVAEILDATVRATHIKEHTMITKTGKVAVVKEHDDSRQEHLASMPAAALHRALNLEPGQQVRHEGTTIDRHDFDHNSEKNQHPDTVEHFSVHNGMESKTYHRSEIESHLKSRGHAEGKLEHQPTIGHIDGHGNVKGLKASHRRTAADVLRAKSAAPASSNLRVNEILGIKGTDKVTASAQPETDSAIAKLVAYLAALRFAHWEADTATNEHKTLGDLYEALDGLVDSFTETFMGKAGVVKCEPATIMELADPTAEGLALVTALKGQAEGDDLQNILADMEGALNKAAYLLKATAPAKATDASTDDAVTARASDVVHCRSASDILGEIKASDRPWKQGEEVSFMFMPAGQHTICAGFRGQSILLTVNIDPERDTQVVQASFQKLVSKYPKQRPFGCIEHEEKDASVWAKGFEAKADGIYLAAEPSALGENHVNGRIHRSWSPSFLTDADYKKAVLQEYPSGKVYEFPAGVRGSEQNPARITGVTFCVGTLTNNPAFKEIDPVRAKEMATTMNTETDKITAAGTSEGVKKAWQTRHAGNARMHEDAGHHLKSAYIGEKYRPAQDLGSMAHYASAEAYRKGSVAAHTEAAAAHHAAAEAHHKNGAAGAASTHEHYRDEHKSIAAQESAYKAGTKASDTASKVKTQEVRSQNEGYGFHGSATESALREAHGTDYEPGKISEDNRKGAEEQAANAFSRAANDLVAHGHAKDHEQARAILDSTLGRHIGDQIGHAGSIQEIGWLKKSIKDWKEQPGNKASDTSTDPDKVTAAEDSQKRSEAAKEGWKHRMLGHLDDAMLSHRETSYAASHKDAMKSAQDSTHAARSAQAIALEQGNKEAHEIASEALSEASDAHMKAMHKATVEKEHGHRQYHAMMSRHLREESNYHTDLSKRAPTGEKTQATAPRTVDAILAGAKPGNQNAAGPHAKHAIGTWVTHPTTGKRGVVTHSYEHPENDPEPNEHGYLTEVDYGTTKANHRAGTLQVHSDQSPTFTSRGGKGAAANIRNHGGLRATDHKPSVEEILKKTSCNPKP